MQQPKPLIAASAWIVVSYIMYLVVPLAAYADTTTVLWEDGEEFVRIEPVDDPAAAPNAHPVQLPAAQIERMLSTLRVKVADSEDQPPLPVFSNPELETLGRYLSEGLARAAPGQDVTFAVMGTRSVTTGGFFRKRLINTGRVFFAEGNLNVIFGEILGSVKKKNIYGRRDQNFDQRHYGLRADPRDQGWDILEGPGLAFHGAGARGDWVLVDTDAAPAERSRDVTPPRQPAPPPAAAVVATPDTPQAPPAPVTPPEPAPPLAAHEPPAPAPEAPAMEPSRQVSDIEGRLQTLKDLRDKGLITEEAYEAKMQEILKEL